MKNVFLILLIVIFVPQPSLGQELSLKNDRILKSLLSKLDKGKKTLDQKYSKKIAEIEKQGASELTGITKPIITKLKALQKQVATEDLDQASRIRDVINDITAGKRPVIDAKAPKKPVVKAEVKKQRAPKLKRQPSVFFVGEYSNDKGHKELHLFLPDGTFKGKSHKRHFGSGKWETDGKTFTMLWDGPGDRVSTGTVANDGFVYGVNEKGEKFTCQLRYSSQFSNVGEDGKQSTMPENISVYTMCRRAKDGGARSSVVHVFINDGRILTPGGEGKWQSDGHYLIVQHGSRSEEIYELKKDGLFVRPHETGTYEYVETPLSELEFQP